MRFFEGFPQFEVVPFRKGSPVVHRRIKLNWYTCGFRMSHHAREDYGFQLPRRFGIGWKDWDTDSMIYFVLPLNVIMAMFRWLYWRVAFIVPNRLSDREVVLEIQIRAGMQEIAETHLDHAVWFIREHIDMDGEVTFERT